MYSFRRPRLRAAAVVGAVAAGPAMLATLVFHPAKAQQYGQPSAYGASSYGTLQPPLYGAGYSSSMGPTRQLDGTPRRAVQREEPSYAWGQPGIWQGLYAGLNTGYSLGRANSTTFQDVQSAGVNFGGHVGYNLQFGNIVVGAEADGAWHQASGSKHFVGYAVVRAMDDFTGSLRLRAGYAFDNMLIYGTAGFGLGHLEIAIDHGPVTSRFTDSLHGYAIGGGMEVKLSHNTSGRIEVLHYGFNEREFQFHTGYLPVRHDLTTIRAGLTLHFN